MDPRTLHPGAISVALAIGVSLLGGPVPVGAQLFPGCEYDHVVEQLGPRDHTRIVNAAADHWWAILQALDLRRFVVENLDPSVDDVLAAMLRAEGIPNGVRTRVEIALRLHRCLRNETGLLESQVEEVEFVMNELREAEDAEDGVRRLARILRDLRESGAESPRPEAIQAVLRILSDGMRDLYEEGVVEPKLPWYQPGLRYGRDLMLADAETALLGASAGCAYAILIGPQGCVAGASAGGAAGGIGGSTKKLVTDIIHRLFGRTEVVSNPLPGGSSP